MSRTTSAFRFGQAAITTAFFLSLYLNCVLTPPFITKMSEASYFPCRLLWMVSGTCVLVLVDPFSSLALMVNNTATFSTFSCFYIDVNFSVS